MPRERQASSTELYWYYTGMIYGRSGLTTSWCLKGRFRIYDIVGGTNQLTRFIFLYSGQMKTQALNNKEKSMFNDTIKITFMWKTVITQTGSYFDLCHLQLSGAFAVLRKATVSFVMSVCPSVRLNITTLGPHWTDFYGILHLSEGKAVPLQALSGPEDSKKLRFPDFMTTAQDGGKVSALRTGRLYPRKNIWYSFLLEA